MRYWKVEMGNGYCGCDEEFVTRTIDNEDLDFEECLSMYSYEGGVAGLNPDDEEFEECSYEECIAENTTWEEITKEEYQSLIDEDGLEERQKVKWQSVQTLPLIFVHFTY